MIETRTIVRKVCPSELTAPLPPKVATPLDLVIDASKAVLGWISDHLAREALLERRIADGSAQCRQ